MTRMNNKFFKINIRTTERGAGFRSSCLKSFLEFTGGIYQSHPTPTTSSDSFYHDDADYWKLWARYGILAIEMETAALYTLAAKFGVRALSILTVSDDLYTGQQATADERQTSFTRMMRIALETLTRKGV